MPLVSRRRPERCGETYVAHFTDIHTALTSARGAGELHRLASSRRRRLRVAAGLGCVGEQQPARCGEAAEARRRLREGVETSLMKPRLL